MTRKIDLLGRVFGDLEVINDAPDKMEGSNKDQKRTQWLCKCKCGKQVLVQSHRLLNKKRPKTSCGCQNFKGETHGNRKHNDPKIISFRALIKAYRASARHCKTKKISYSLTEQEALELFNGHCFYCGSQPNNTYNVYMTKGGKFRGNEERAKKAEIIFNGIDRISSDLGYTTSNVVSCCKTCNYAKHEMSLETFLEWIKMVAYHQSFIKNENYSDK